MAEVDLPRGLKGSEDLPHGREALINCFWVDGEILPRPGHTSLGSTFTNLARGCFNWNGSIYTVYGKELYKLIDREAGTHSLIGTIEGSSPISVAIGFNDVVILAKDAAIYTLNKMDFLTDITTNLNFVPVTAVTHIDGRFVYIPTNGEPAFFSDVGAAGTVQAASFFDAEELPDLNNTVFNFANTLYIGGTDSFELFRNTGGFPNPFTRIQGARHRYGFIGGLMEYTNSFLFLGREKDQDFGFYAIGPGQTEKISNSFIDKRLSTYAPEELAECRAARFKWRGYDLATFSLARDAWGFYRGEWFGLNTLVDGFPKTWIGGYVAQLDGIYYAAAKRNFGKIDKVNTDFGQRIAKVIDIGFRHPNNQRFSCQSLELAISQGFNAEVGSVALFMSRDNRTYGPANYQDLGALGEYRDRLGWNPSGGLGNYDGFMGVRIYSTADIAFAADKMYLNIR